MDAFIEKLSRKNKRLITHGEKEAKSATVDASLLYDSTTLSSIALSHHHSLLMSLPVPFHLFYPITRTFISLR
jgi:hypothetical protein